MRNIDRENNIDVNAINYSPIATFKQGDNATLELTLFKNGQEFDITGQTITLGAYRPNNTVIEQIDGFTINRNVLIIKLKNSVLAIHGIVEIELNLEDSEGEMTTSSFFIKVNKKVLGEDNLAASDEFNSLKQLKIDLQNAKRDETTRIENEKIRVNNEIKRQEFYENKAKLLVEDLKNYDSKITTNTKNIRKNALDIERAFEVINNGSYLPFEGENVNIEHSKVGFTKDMKVEGITYQNLIKMSSAVALDTWLQCSNWIFRLQGSNTVTVVNLCSKPIRFQTSKINEDESYGRGIKIQSNTTTVVNINENEILRDIIATVEDGWATNDETQLNEFKKGVVVLKGKYNNLTLPYFEGIKSVGELENKISILSYGGKNLYTEIELGDIDNSTGKLVVSNRFFRTKHFINVKPRINYTEHSENEKYLNAKLYEYDINKNFIKAKTLAQSTFTTSENTNFIKIVGRKNSQANIEPNDLASLKLSLNEGTSFLTPYEPRKKNKKEILITMSNGLKGLIDEAYDTLESSEDGVYLIQKIGRTIEDGSKTYDYVEDLSGTDVLFFFRTLSDGAISSTKISTLSDKFTAYATINRGTNKNRNIEACYLGDGSRPLLQFHINKSKLETPDIAGFKKWLQTNPVTVYYELAEPIEYKISNLNSINLETYKDITYIFGENEIQPKLSFKAPVDVQATISSLRSKNANLEHENKELKDEINTKTLKLHDQDVELTNSDLDLDFRIFELEMNIGLPINLNIKGVKNMARSPFEMMKILILNNNYDREDIEYKASRYLKGGRMTQEEYNEIISLMDANELVK